MQTKCKVKHLLLTDKNNKDGEVNILMEARLCEIFKNETVYEVIGEKFHGNSLQNKTYTPILKKLFACKFFSSVYNKLKIVK